MCWKCGKLWWGAVLILLGVLLLLRDLEVWDFWNITPWTLVFLLLGIGVATTSMCKCDIKAKKK